MLFCGHDHVEDIIGRACSTGAWILALLGSLKSRFPYKFQVKKGTTLISVSSVLPCFKHVERDMKQRDMTFLQRKTYKKHIYRWISTAKPGYKFYYNAIWLFLQRYMSFSTTVYKFFYNGIWVFLYLLISQFIYNGIWVFLILNVIYRFGMGPYY